MNYRILIAATVLGAAPALAHHSFALYDTSKTSEITGTVQKFEWTNPHCWLFVDVPDPNGAIRTYGFELRSVGELMRDGWKKRSLHPGDKVKVAFRPTRDGSPAGQLKQAWNADGELIGSAPQTGG